MLASRSASARLLADVKDALSLLLLRLVLYNGLPKRRLPVDRVELCHRLIKKLVIDRVQIVNDLIAGVPHGDDVAVLPLHRAATLHVGRQDEGVSQALEALGIELLLVAKHN